MTTVSHEEKLQKIASLPKGISQACTAIFFYTLVVVLNAVLVGVQTGRYFAVSGAALLALWALQLNNNLVETKKWAWWTAVGFGSLLQARYLIGIGAWFLNQQKGLHPEVQLVVYYAVCSLILAFAIPPLMKREVRQAFGLMKMETAPATTGVPPIPEP